jgi:nucleoid-associated protein YgaU
LAPLLSGDADGGLHLAGVSSVVVEPGDTLWSIAAAVADGEDVRVVVDRIQELNGLHGSDVVPGQVLELP